MIAVHALGTMQSEIWAQNALFAALIPPRRVSLGHILENGVSTAIVVGDRGLNPTCLKIISSSRNLFHKIENVCPKSDFLRQIVEE
jgi:hypothetical protein